MFNLEAFSVARLAESLYADYLGYDALLKLGRDLRAAQLIPPTEPGQNVPVGRIGPLQAGRGAIEYHYVLFLERALESGREHDHARVWLGGALITLGDALTRHEYFDRAPLLEVVRHMRNAVGHGNRFEIRNPEQLTRYPAMTTRTLESGAVVPVAITPELHHTCCLFEFMAEHEVLSLIQRVEMHLSSLAGDIPDDVDIEALRRRVLDEWRRVGSA